MNDIVKSVIFGIITVVVYFGVVVVTTPALNPDASIRAALQLNSVIIFGMGIGIGLQVYLSEKAKRLGCRIRANKTSPSGTFASSFFSFFSLVPLGCCGWWLYVLSLLPSVFGSTISAVLITYSQPLAYAGLSVIFVFNAITALRLKQQKFVKLE
jgi:hypothetical protein